MTVSENNTLPYHKSRVLDI